MKVLILGVGSPFGSDNLGWQAIDGLIKCGLERVLAPHEVRLEKADRPGALLLERMQGFDCVILIDALQGGEEPGRVRSLNIEEIAQNDVLLSGHGLGVAEALKLGKVLGDLPPQIKILGVGVGQVDGGSEEHIATPIDDQTLTDLSRYILGIVL